MCTSIVGVNLLHISTISIFTYPRQKANLPAVETPMTTPLLRSQILTLKAPWPRVFKTLLLICSFKPRLWKFTDACRWAYNRNMRVNLCGERLRTGLAFYR